MAPGQVARGICSENRVPLWLTFWIPVAVTWAVAATQGAAVLIHSSAFSLESFWMQSLAPQGQEHKFSAQFQTGFPLFLYIILSRGVMV